MDSDENTENPGRAKAPQAVTNDHTITNTRPDRPAARLGRDTAGRDQLPVAAFRGELVIGDARIMCFVLDDGRRVLSGRAVTRAMGLTSRDRGMNRFLEAKSLRPFMSDKLVHALEEPIEFRLQSTGRSPLAPLGYEAFILPELCNMVIDANDAQSLQSLQLHMVQRAKILSRGFSTVGIMALVDEATGYQEVRDRDELHRILEAYIAKELLPWTRRFPAEFYEQLFRLRGWQYKPLSLKRPKLVGRLTSEIVYERLPEGVLEELRRKNPVVRPGVRRYRHHQFLTEDVGNPHLEKHLAVVTALMRASRTWADFKRLLERAIPGSRPQQTSFIDDGEGGTD